MFRCAQHSHLHLTFGKYMNRDLLIDRITSPFRKGLWLSIAGILCAVVLLNTPAEMLGYWIFGASLVYLGLNLRLIRDTKSSIIVCASTPLTREGELLLEADGIKLQVSPNMVEPIKKAEGYSRVKGTLLIFRNV